MNTLALYAQSQALASSQEKTTVAENTGSATAQSNNLGDSSSSSTSSTTDTSGTSGTPTKTRILPIRPTQRPISTSFLPWRR